MFMKPWPSCTALAVLLAAILGGSGCGAPGKGSSQDKLTQDLSLELAPYQILNLTTGAVTGLNTVSDLQTNAAYKQNLMVFRRVSGATATGTPLSGLGAGIDAPAGRANAGTFYCGVFEVTQGQWQALAGVGNRPWESALVNPSGELGSLTTVDDLPAFALSENAIATVLAAFNVGKASYLGIPSDTQWECACRAGTNSAFSWGNDPDDRATALLYAVVGETNSGQKGARVVGQRQPNAFGLYDMHGNVWEITHTGLNTSIHGGSWRDPLALARSAHAVVLDRGTAHALVGVRLVLTP
jgi:formylglycine-generating enzyme required for sulfatase activity